MSLVTRRQLIRNGMVAGGALAGAGGAGRFLADAPGPPPATELRVRAEGLRMAAATFRRGRQPAVGERILVTADLIDDDDNVVGQLYGVYIALDRSGRGTAASLEQHTFVLADGSLVGTGTGTRDLDHVDAFAVVGGTGRYAGATGTYSARQRPVELGGDGTAEFVITLAS